MIPIVSIEVLTTVVIGKGFEVMYKFIRVLTIHPMKGRELSQGVDPHGIDNFHHNARWWILYRQIFVLPK